MLYTVCPRLEHKKLLLRLFHGLSTLVSERKIIKPTQQPHVIFTLLGETFFAFATKTYAKTYTCLGNLNFSLIFGDFLPLMTSNGFETN